MAGKDTLAEPRRKSLDLRLDPLGHVFIGAAWHMAIRPGRVLARGSASRIEQALLCEQYEWPFGNLARPDSPFPSRDVVDEPTDMDSRGSGAPRIRPGDGAVEREVKLEDPRAVAVALKLSTVARGQSLTRYLEQLARCDVRQDDIGGRKLIERGYRRVGDDLTTKAAQVRREGIHEACEPPRAIGQPATWPSVPMSSPATAVGA